MKRTLLSIVFSISFTIAYAQFGTAHDFTVTDINGEAFHLYSVLDEGKVVVLDVSTTWCPPCWEVHQAHYLRDLNNKWGSEGTDQIRVLFYEGDPTTTMADLEGTGSNTLGDWVTGLNYPIVNESPLQLDIANIYAPFGFPTINIIRPEDREITADVWDQNLAGMEAAINQIITLGTVNNVKEATAKAANVKVFPNPAMEETTIDLSDVAKKIESLTIVNALGQSLKTVAVDEQNFVNLSVAGLAAGVYFINLVSEGETYATKRLQKL